MTRNILFLACLIGACLGAQGSAAKDCRSWGDATLTGFVVEGVYPGPPNYSSVPDGDAALDATLLHLEAPICITGDAPEADGPVRAIELIQLACAGADFPRGVPVTVSGELFPRHTSYHVTAAVLACPG